MLENVENIVPKGENAGCQHFLLFLQCFYKHASTESVKLGIMSFVADHSKYSGIVEASKVSSKNFDSYTGIRLSIRLSVCPSVYRILVSVKALAEASSHI